MVKAHLAICVTRDLLGNKSVCSSQNQTELLDRLNKAISCGEDMIVDFGKNYVATLKLMNFGR